MAIWDCNAAAAGRPPRPEDQRLQLWPGFILT